MRASQLIAQNLVHAVDPEITGTITDICFDMTLTEVEFVLCDMTTPIGTAPVLLSPKVMIIDAGRIKVSAHPDDVTQRVDTAIHQTSVDVDPTGLPTTLIGPFGNTISPSLIAALFNARTNPDVVKAPVEGGGIWFTELQDHAIRAHVADIGHVKDVVLHSDLTTCDVVEVAAFDNDYMTMPPANIQIDRIASGSLSLSIKHAGDSY